MDFLKAMFVGAVSTFMLIGFLYLCFALVVFALVAIGVIR